MLRLRDASDRQLRVLLILLSLAVRVPYWRTFDLVTFDGAFYVNQARALLHGTLGGGVFSIGYPLVIAPLMLIVRDGVTAARTASLLAAIGAVLLLFELCRRFVGRGHAFLGAFVYSVTPLLIQVSVLSNAESVLVCWLLAGAVCYATMHSARSGLAIGMAAATRPEALAVGGVLAALHVRTPRALAAFALCFAAVYGVNIAVISAARGSFTPLSRVGAYHSTSAPWQVQEKALDMVDVDALAGDMAENGEPVDRGADYASRMPRMLLLLGRQLLPLVPLLALFGMLRRPNFVLVLLAPLPLLPFFSVEREQTRWLAPYLAPLVFYAMVALDAIRPARARVVATWLVALSTVVTFWANRSLLERGPESDFETTQDVARGFASHVQPGDMMADRKPYFALYAGARYVEIPVASYHDTIDHLAQFGVRYLSLDTKSIALRPALLQLVYDATAVRGELRYRQALVAPTGEMIWERVRADDPVATRPLTQSDAIDFAPAWSPDGSQLAFRRQAPNGDAAIWVVDASGEHARELVRTNTERDALAWSPDGRRVAYAALHGRQLDLFAVDVRTARTTKLFDSPDFEWSPSWIRASGALVFCGDPGGLPSVWLLGGKGATPERLSDTDAADLASVAPSGDRVAWVDLGGRLVVMDLESKGKRTIDEPRQILSTASWSPDERYVAVEAYDWGSSNVYIIDVRENRAVMLTHAATGEGMPSWSPRGDQIAILFDRPGRTGISVLSGLAEPLARLSGPDEIRVFDRPEVTRIAPRENLRRVRAAPSRP